MSKDIYTVLDKIVVSEKASLLNETNNEVVFKVAKDANKLQIKEAVEKLLGKKVVAVRTANYFGKLKRQRRSDAGRTANWKKAIVRLAEGESIDLV